MEVRAFPGIPGDPARAAVATGYMAGSIAIDAPEGVLYPSPSMILLTHEHCDHIVGVLLHNCPIGASAQAAEAVGSGSPTALCAHLGLPHVQKRVERVYSEGDRIEGDGFALEVLETPGHSSGALCFYLPERRYLFCGDTVFPEGFLPSVSLPTSDPSALADSYEKLAALEIGRFFPGHGEPFSSPGYMEKLLRAVRQP